MRGDGSAAERGSLRSYLILWIAPALVDAYLALGLHPRPEPWQFVVEILLMAAAGRTQWRLGRGWVRTPLLPALVLVIFTAALHTPPALHQAIPYVVGLITGSLGIGWAIGRRWMVPLWVGIVASVCVVVGARPFDAALKSDTGHDAGPSLMSQVLWPLRGSAPRGPGIDGPPLVIISIDTLRVDAAASMASFQRLAKRGASWPRAMSTSSWTLPALGSLQTGLMPSAHGAACIEDGHCQGLSADVRTLAQDLADAGWATGAIVANPWASESTGFDRGFATFQAAGQSLNRLLVTGPPAGEHRQDDSRTVDAALEWLRHAPARGMYLWVHLIGPHMPYLHVEDEDVRGIEAAQLRNGYPTSPATKRKIRAAYDAEVAYTDAQVQRLLDALEARGVLDDGVVVFTSDHGEEFWEHGGVEHGHSHHGEVVDVPLVLVAPGVDPGERSGVASLVDVPSTLRAVAGLPTDGIDLRQSIPPTRIATAWGGLIMHLDCSARGTTTRVIARDCERDAPRSHAFDLTRDPEELRPLPAEPLDPVTQAAWAVRAPTQGSAARLPTEQLRALGYLQ